MDTQNLYLSTLRYVMNADPTNKSTWCDIFKYLPCLRQMLSCCVCGSILLRPHGPANNVCLHHVCEKCKGGQMRLKPSCSWCKDHDHFLENKRLRILILCFKKLCAYISNTELKAEISKSSVNGLSMEAECLLQILEDAERLNDDYILTPPSKEILTMTKSSDDVKTCEVGLHMPSSSVTVTNPEILDQATLCLHGESSRGRGRPLKTSKLSNSHLKAKVNKIRKKALNSKRNLNQAKRSYKKKLPPEASHFLISQRPHRDKTGKHSVGQLWRETFLEEVPPETYPDSGIEVGNYSDQDQNSPPSLQTASAVEKNIRCQVLQEVPQERDLRSKSSMTDVSSTTHDLKKPRLTLTISKKHFQKFDVKERFQNSPKSKIRKEVAMTEFKSLAGSTLKLKQANLKKKANPETRRLRYTAPPLVHVLRESDNLDSSFDSSMPRLSPIQQL